MLDMEKICRVCLSNDAELFLMFDEKYAEQGTKVNIAMMLTEFTKYKVERFDELPQCVCSACMSSVQSAYELKRKCEESYRTLIKLLPANIRTAATLAAGIKVENIEHIEKSTQTEDSSLHPCERCNEKFFSFDALRAHRENEHKGSAMVCRFCAKTFNRIGYLKTHIAVFHPETGYISHNQCHICKRQFTRREHMRRHLAVIHKIVEIAEDDEHMNIEEEEQQQQSHLNETIEEQLNDITKECTTHTEESLASNDESDSSAAAVKAEQMQEHNIYRDDDDNTRTSTEDDDDEDEKPLANFINSATTKGFIEVLLNDGLADDDQISESTKAGETTRHTEVLPHDECKSGLSVYKKRGRGRPPRCLKAAANAVKEEHSSKDIKYPCKICTKYFSSAELLKHHMQSKHDAAKVMKCNECEQIFTHITQFKRHKETKHSEKCHKCELCQKSFTTKVYLQRHMAIHGKKRYVCKECSASYLTKDELSAHIKADGHDKPMLCPECGLRCKTSNILMVHMRRHNGEKPFKCKFCSKGFPRVDDLRVHEKYHTGEKSHFCETCGKGFQRKYNLTIHLRVHSGEKPYKCPHCPQAFAQGNDLKAHIRRHTGERFRCEICGAAFLQGYQIRQHKLIEHNIKETPPTQRVAKFISPEEQEQQIKQNLQREIAETQSNTTDSETTSAKEQQQQQQNSDVITLTTLTTTTIADEAVAVTIAPALQALPTVTTTMPTGMEEEFISI